MRGRALIIATSRYSDPELPELPSAVADAKGLNEVLGDPRIGDFSVTTRLESGCHECRVGIDDFFAEARKDELLLLYISGHGVKEAAGQLYFAVGDTRTSRLNSTGIPASFIQDVANGSKSQSIAIILDTCFSGAFASRLFKGMKADQRPTVRVDDCFRESTGRVVITASDAFQYAQAGEAIDGEVRPSLFSSHIIHGLRTGEADGDGDGNVSSKDLYEYVLARMHGETPHQRPKRWEFGLQGDLVIAANPLARRRKLAQEVIDLLPKDVIELIGNPAVRARCLAAQDLRRLAVDSPLPPQAAWAIHQALEHLQEDDNREVSEAARRAVQELQDVTTARQADEDGSAGGAATVLQGQEAIPRRLYILTRRRWAFVSWGIFVCFLLAAVLLWFYFSMRLPPRSLMPWIQLAGSLVVFLAGVAALGLKLVELRLKLSATRAKGH
jgi:hypothetical protein